MKSFKTRIKCLTFMVMLTGSVSFADITVGLLDNNGLFLDSGFTTPLPAGSLLHLIWSADNVYAGFGAGSGPLDTEVSGGDYSAYGDYLLWSGFTTVDGGWAGDLDGATNYLPAAVGGANINNGYVYAYVFQDAIPNAGDFFARSTMPGPVLGEQTNSPPDSPSFVVFADTAPQALDTYTIQVIPEPSTMILMLLGFVAIGGFKKRSRK